MNEEKKLENVWMTREGKRGKQQLKDKVLSQQIEEEGNKNKRS